MIKVLSVENWEPNRSWSWGIVINNLIAHLPDYEFVRIRRGEFGCDNPKCRRVFYHQVDKELCGHFDIIFPQNVDTIRMIPEGERIVARIGGIDMSNPETDRYAKDFQRVAHIIATNQQLYDIAVKSNPNCTLIANGVDLDLFKPAQVNPNFDRKFMLGFAGNIWGGGADYKGWMPYVQACSTLMMDGVEQKHLLHQANQIDHDKMPAEFYQQIDALVLPSKGEGCSNVVSEALACGVPCLLTKVGYHGEMLQDKINCLFIERNADSIIQAVRHLISNPDLRTLLSKNGRLFAEQYHDVRKIAAQYDEIFKRILSGKERKAG
jgi:glycosyltransferase involved in cell wall biosynthesis